MSQQINLFNPLFLRREKYFSARTMLQALGLVVVGLGAFYAYAVWETRALGGLVAQQDSDVAHERARVVEMSGAQGQGRLHVLQADAQRLQSEARAREALLDKLRSGDLGNSAGFSRYFAAFARHALAGVWLTGFSVGEGGNELQVRGRALEPDLLPDYLRALNLEDVMRGRQVIALRLTAGTQASAAQGSAVGGPARFVEFTIAAPLRAPDPDAALAQEKKR